MTYDEDANRKFLDMVDKDGYVVDEDTGIIRSKFSSFFFVGLQSLK